MASPAAADHKWDADFCTKTHRRGSPTSATGRHHSADRPDRCALADDRPGTVSCTERRIYARYIPVDGGHSVIATLAPATSCQLMDRSDPAARSAAAGPWVLLICWTTRWRASPTTVAGRTPASRALPATAWPPQCRSDDRSRADPPAVTEFVAGRGVRNRTVEAVTQWCWPGCQQHAATSADEPATARRTPGSDADACWSRTGRAVLRGRIPQRTANG
jgi:hypothetical protein